MSEIICVNDLFTTDTLEIYEKYGISTPVLDSMYNVRDVIINSNGMTGFLLEEIINPHIPITHPLIGKMTMEPNFHVDRFRYLNGTNVDALALKREFSQVIITKY